MRVNLMVVSRNTKDVIFLKILRADGMPFVEYKYDKPSKASSLKNEDFKEKMEESIAGLDPMPNGVKLKISSLKKFKRRWGCGTPRMLKSKE